MTRRLALLLAVAAQGLVLSGCGKDIAEATGFATTPQESKAFVKEARQAEADYIPVGSAVTRAAPRKPVADFKKLETDLEAKRISNEAAGNQAKQLGTTPPPAPAAVP
ncbi:hypothetical protein DWE98_12830 [Bosea caraganae]|uniref:DUF4148 domain-containing protein n=2 Tax=Bosea caraganae TaxID=2763117 RepID=A0A370L5Z5_9HYPH|nr:hypothetical protein DWE98_12830 [Bosea caraganae]